MKKIFSKIYNTIAPWRTENGKIIKILKMYRRSRNKIFKELYLYIVYKKTHCCFSNGFTYSDNISFPHLTGIVIGAGVKIGKNVTIYQNVTLGRKDKDISEYPTIEDNVTIYCNSTVVGNVTIGKGAVIGCNSVVLRDVKPGEVVSGIVK